MVGRWIVWHDLVGWWIVWCDLVGRWIRWHDLVVWWIGWHTVPYLQIIFYFILYPLTSLIIIVYDTTWYSKSSENSAVENQNIIISHTEQYMIVQVPVYLHLRSIQYLSQFFLWLQTLPKFPRGGDSIIIAHHEMYHFINHHFSRDLLYKFPKNSGCRSFQHQWMMRYPWLRYCKQKDGGYCLKLPCVLFCRRKNLRASAGVLVINALTNFKNATDILRKHVQKDYHKEAVATMDQFMEVMSGQQDCVSVQINNIAKELVVKKRKKLESTIETIILSGRQNIPLRGHHDAGTDLEQGDCGSHENFWALLQFPVSAGDTILREHLASAPQNANYTSPNIQNQVIEVLGDHILQKSSHQSETGQVFSV